MWVGNFSDRRNVGVGEIFKYGRVLGNVFLGVSLSVKLYQRALMELNTQMNVVLMLLSRLSQLDLGLLRDVLICA